MLIPAYMSHFRPIFSKNLTIDPPISYNLVTLNTNRNHIPQARLHELHGTQDKE